MEELAKRAVACKHWRWMAGMSDKQGFRFIGPLFEDRASADSALPDLSDPATLGCLLSLVLSVLPEGARVVFVKDGSPLHVESLVKALEAAD
jgi:hypothetical protein